MPKFTHTGPVWNIVLTHQEAEGLEGLLGSIAAIASVIPGAGPGIAAALGGIGAIILMVDAIGGDNGVEASGVVNTAGVVVTPVGSGFIALLVQAAQVTINPQATIIDFILKAGGIKPDFAGELGITAAVSVVTAIAAGTPIGWALAGVGLAGAVVNLLEAEPNPNQHGGVRADRTAIGDWERFIMAEVAPPDHVSLLSWRGIFSADGGGGSGVYANRAKVGPWETWTLVRNNDGTFSFKSTNGHYLTALGGGGGGSTCYSDRTAIGDWEKFVIVPLPKGHIALKTHLKGTYVSVQSDL